MADWTIASWNVNSVRSRMHIVLDWLHDVRPDALCLQETKVDDKNFPAEDIRLAGYNVAFSGEPTYNGVAIISQSEPKDVFSGLGTKKNPDESRIIAATVDGVRIVNTYVPQGRDVDHEMFVYKLDWFDRLKKYFQKNNDPSDLLIWAGDLNVAPEDKDVHNPKRLKEHVDFHPEVQKKLAEVMEFGLIDVFRKHEPGEGQYTFWDYRVKDAIKKGLGWRIDHILTTETLAEMSKQAWIDTRPRTMKKPSDHTPICARFKLD